MHHLQHVAFAPAATAWEVAGAVAYLHGEGIVHGDVCSSNVLLKVAQTQRGFTSKVGQGLQGQQLPDHHLQQPAAPITVHAAQSGAPLLVAF